MYVNSNTTLTVDYVSNSGDIATVHFANGQSADVHPQAFEDALKVEPLTMAQFTFDGAGHIIAVGPVDE